MEDALKELYNVILDRRSNPTEGSYTCYLFEQGLDKILKKCGEECSETIIAAKNLAAAVNIGEMGEREAEAEATVLDSKKDMLKADVENEVCDLIYHLMVLLVQMDIPLESIGEILEKRSAKIGNLKQFHTVERNS
ncbi:MAG: phosphoribosyl-ATP diphosphatase [Clostridiales Family XIII bacterium]|jgi:phosphoribosyl-ATP pyrophosphohydrolase|nr:phosphoribosyl-ATP diphosphatase [Clostridiales Family XIII bacterium]